MTDEVIEGTAVEVYQPPAQVGLFGTTDPDTVVAKAAGIANTLKNVLRANNLLSSIGGREHVKVEGWQLLGMMLGVTAVCVATDEVTPGTFRATVEARTADGRVIGRADAVCSKDERTWKSRDDYARLSMAQTRATSKALKGPLGFVVSLAGYETTPAEEMPGPTHDGRWTNEPPATPLSARGPRGGDRLDDLLAAAKGMTLAAVQDCYRSVGLEAPRSKRECFQGLTAEQAAWLIAALRDRNPRTAKGADPDRSDVPSDVPVDGADEDAERIAREVFGDGITVETDAA